jgi:hypothetical protein
LRDDSPRISRRGGNDRRYSIVGPGRTSAAALGSGDGTADFHLREPVLLILPKMDVPFEGVRSDRNEEPLGQEQAETMNEVIRQMVALVDERVVTIHGFHRLVIVVQLCEKWVTYPKFRASGADVRYERAWRREVNVPNGCGQHKGIARRLGVA